MLTRIRDKLTAAWNRLLGRKPPPPNDQNPTPTFGGGGNR